MINRELSDLFFNISKDKYDEALREAGDDEPSPALIRAAVQLDAVEFVASYPTLSIAFDPIDAHELANDFLRRR